jgi:hypothetical protein
MIMMCLKIDDKRRPSGRNFSRIINKRAFDLIRTLPIHDERKPFSAFQTSYGHHYSQNSLSREPTKTSM